MRYTVTWVPTALNALADLWNNAPDRKAIAQAADRIDQLLAVDPDQQGQAFHGKRILFNRPSRSPLPSTPMTAEWTCCKWSGFPSNRRRHQPMLTIKNLHARVEDKEILRGIDLQLNPGEVHALMGPNGSGKSTLAGVLAGRDLYDVTEGEVLFQGKDLLDMDPEERARAGIFLAFQYPVEIPGVSNTYFLRAALNAVRKHRGQPDLDAPAFLRLVKEKLKVLHIGDDLLKRPVNAGFSGGEKKRNEIFQMAVLDPKLAILDETDSGLDIDALRTVADGVNALRNKERGILVITHYQRLLNYIVPDRVHVLHAGRIVKSGGKELALELESRGYGWIEEEAAAGTA